MPELARQVGLGLAARGSVADTIAWAQAARDRGLGSVWFHDSYFERDAVTYASAVASSVEGIDIGLGAVNPYTRHPVLLAMTVSALDEMAPGRIVCAIGSALPLRLAQMQIPYRPEEAVERVTHAIDVMRALWRGERVPVPTPGVPELQPMFPPVHRTPIYVAGYRTPMVELAGRIADGYLARPAESLASFRVINATLRGTAVAAGRDESAVTAAGYLLTLIEDSRREALNRAKREVFVIYMMSILSDVALKRAGFEPELRDQIAAAWRAEEYHRAAEAIPDELVDAFLLCGTEREVAAKCWEYHDAGMNIPLLQPIVQEEGQVERALHAATLFGTEGAAAASVTTAGEQDGAGLSHRAGALWEITRPFALTATFVPVSAGAALAAVERHASWLLYILALASALLLQIGTNVINEIYDVRKGIDSITSPRASLAIVKGRISERAAFVFAISSFVTATALGGWLIYLRGWPIAVIGLIAVAGGAGYTAPPLEYKYRALGIPLVFILMGPLMVEGAYFSVSGSFSWHALVVSIPVGLLVAAILHGNEWRDISDDARAGIVTLSIRFGRRAAYYGYLSLVVGAYIALAAGVMADVVPRFALLAMMSLPLLVRAIRASELGARGDAREIAMIDLQTAQLHATFGVLLVAGLAASALRA
ncbi:MAG: LLM class flavin-dependent oxidoreductase [Actinomycetota bacterium]|nr:LLM class flavin-dependent oxidoreductase [Actinomycetota bacterium]